MKGLFAWIGYPQTALRYERKVRTASQNERTHRLNSTNREPWVWILETVLSKVDGGNCKRPYSFDSGESPQKVHAQKSPRESAGGLIGLKTLQCLVRPAGIEPATPAFGGQYSIH
jgi:hypothetical protein